MSDRRYALKIKIKSLAAEARIIRHEEKRAKAIGTMGARAKRESLYLHRTGIVRREARYTLLAYGFLRGKSYAQLEAKCKLPPNWKKVQAMVEKYGASNPVLLKNFEEWKNGGTQSTANQAA